MFNGMNIAFLAGSSQNDQFLEWSKMHNFFYTSNLYPTEEAAFDALNNDSVDAVVMGSLSNQKGYKIKTQNPKPKPKPKNATIQS